jgi:RNA polymerase subunit RPABC4/transcription elongation factor Spt4
MCCLKCKVCIEDHHKYCPLCGSEATASVQQIELVTAPYPEKNVEIYYKQTMS